MNVYFGIRRSYSKEAPCIKLDYSFEEVPDPLAIDTPEGVSDTFLEKFDYRIDRGTRVEDVLCNNIGWFIFSPRIVRLLQATRNSRDIQLSPLPEKAYKLDSRLKGYCVMG